MLIGVVLSGHNLISHTCYIIRKLENKIYSFFLVFICSVRAYSRIIILTRFSFFSELSFM